MLHSIQFLDVNTVAYTRYVDHCLGLIATAMPTAAHVVYQHTDSEALSSSTSRHRDNIPIYHPFTGKTALISEAAILFEKEERHNDQILYLNSAR